jgi:hypothetical protein
MNIFARNARAGSYDRVIIAISGASGAGKSTLVHKVAGLLGDAVVLHFDDYEPVANYPTDLGPWLEAGRNLDAWQIPQLLDDLKALREGQAISLPVGKGRIQPAKFIVLEEPSGRVRSGLRELIDFVVLIELPLEIALARKVVEYLNYYLKEVPNDQLPEAVQRIVDYYSQYPLHREYYLTLVERVRADCDLVLDGTKPIDALAAQIVEAIQSLRQCAPRLGSERIRP